MARGAINRWTAASLGLLAVTAGLAGCSADADEQADTAVGHRSSAIGGGTPDDGLTAKFPSVGVFLGPPGCTAILITPTWVLTAKHCIAGAYEEPGTDLDSCTSESYSGYTSTTLQVGFTATGDAGCLGGPCVLHTPLVSGPAKNMGVHGQVDDLKHSLCQDVGVASDIAVVQLDARVPLSLLTPHFPPLLPGVPECGDGDTMTNVGYGPTSDPKFGGIGGVRAYNTSSDWGREGLLVGAFGDVNDSVAYYTNYWQFPFEEYKGAYPGDSGGPLFRASDLALCGVASTTDFETENVCPDPFPCYQPVRRTKYAAVDSPNAKRFFKAAHVVDEYGQFMGLCKSGDPFARDIDTDNDLIPDACDPCPYDPDPDYRATGKYAARFDVGIYPKPGGGFVNDTNGNGIPDNDQDQDGIPDVCDNCPSKANPRKWMKQPGTSGSSAPHGLYQDDADVDGLGDACDKCTNSDFPELVCCDNNGTCPKALSGQRCVPVEKNAFPGANKCLGKGRCLLPSDRDEDGRPDICDNCPTATQFAQTDTDGDGVGDACDMCNGITSHDALPEGATVDTFAVDRETPACNFIGDPNADTFCKMKLGYAKSICVETPSGGRCANCDPQLDPSYTGNSECKDKTKNSKSVCVVHGKMGICSEGTSDTDGDGIGDRCDGCPGTPSAFDSNCNANAEIHNGAVYPLATDACDRYPCVVNEQGSGVGPFADANMTKDIWSRVTLDPHILGRDNAGAFPYPANADPRETVGLRYCPCEFENAEKCNDACPVNADQYVDPASPWFVPLVHTTLDLPGPPSGKFTPASSIFASGAEYTNLPPSNASPFAAQDPQLHGKTVNALWNVSLASGAAYSPAFTSGSVICTSEFTMHGVLWSTVRDVTALPSGSNTIFRPRSSHYDVDSWGRKRACSHPVVPVAPFCDWCLDNCPTCKLEGIAAVLWLPDPPSLLALDPAGPRTMAAVPPDVLTRLSNGDRLYNAADGIERGMRSRFDLVITSAAGDPYFGQVAGGSLIRVGGGRGPRGLLAAGKATSPASTEPLFVASGAEEVLFRVSVDSPNHGVIHTRGPDDEDWTLFEVKGANIQTPLAVTYRSADRSLYVLDVTGQGGKKKVRLLRIGLQDRKVKILDGWVQVNEDRRYFLSIGSNGELVLATSSPPLAFIKGFAIAVLLPTDDSVKLGGLALEFGKTLAAAPALGRGGLSLPVFGSDGRLAMETRNAPKLLAGKGVDDCF